MKIVKITIIIFLILFLFMSCSSEVSKKVIPVTKNGVIDLSDWDFEKDGTIELNGEWDFYWKTFLDPVNFVLEPDARQIKSSIKVPGIWNSIIDPNIPGEKKVGGVGYATYVLQIKGISPEFINTLAFSMRTAITAYALYLIPKHSNFLKELHPIMTNGVVSSDPSLSIPQWLPQLQRIPKAAENSIIVLHISNYHYRNGGMWNPLLLGTEKNLRKQYREKKFVLTIVLGVLLMTSLYHIGLFSQRREDISSLMFGLFSLAFFFHVIFVDNFIAEFFPKPSVFLFELFHTLVCIFYISCVPFFYSFLRSVFKNDFDKRVEKILWTLLILFSFASVSLEARLFSYIEPIFHIIMIIAGLHILWCLFKAVVDKRSGAYICFISFIVLLATIGNDLLYDHKIIHTLYFSHYSFIFFVFSQSYMLSVLFAQTYRRSEELYAALNKAYLETEQKVIDRTAQLNESLKNIKQSKAKLVTLNTALQEAEIKTRSLLENSPDFIININQEYKIQYLNMMESGFIAQGSVGKLISEVLPSEYRDVFNEAIKGVFKSGKRDMLETKIDFKNGKIKWYETRFASIQKGGSITEIMLIVTNITKRKRAEIELAATQRELMETAHMAGMADIASGTLHNVGNILNSIKISSQYIQEKYKKSNVGKFLKANQILRENIDDVEDFVCNHPKGKKLLDYYLRIEQDLIEEQNLITSQLERLNSKIENIEEVIVALQNYTDVGHFSGEYNLPEIIDDSLTMQADLIAQHNIRIEKIYDNIPKIKIQKSKLLHILINIIKNAAEAMMENSEEQFLKIRIESNVNSANIRIADNGCGIEKEDLIKIFTHGFTTKKERHGFSLHNSANYMREMGGKIWAESEGHGTGATFVLKFQYSGLAPQAKNK